MVTSSLLFELDAFDRMEFFREPVTASNFSFISLLNLSLPTLPFLASAADMAADSRRSLRIWIHNCRQSFTPFSVVKKWEGFAISRNGSDMKNKVFRQCSRLLLTLLCAAIHFYTLLSTTVDLVCTTATMIRTTAVILLTRDHIHNTSL